MKNNEEIIKEALVRISKIQPVNTENVILIYYDLLLKIQMEEVIKEIDRFEGNAYTDEEIWDDLKEDLKQKIQGK